MKRTLLLLTILLPWVCSGQVFLKTGNGQCDYKLQYLPTKASDFDNNNHDYLLQRLEFDDYNIMFADGGLLNFHPLACKNKPFAISVKGYMTSEKSGKTINGSDPVMKHSITYDMDHHKVSTKIDIHGYRSQDKQVYAVDYINADYDNTDTFIKEYHGTTLYYEEDSLCRITRFTMNFSHTDDIWIHYLGNKKIVVNYNYIPGSDYIAAITIEDNAGNRLETVTYDYTADGQVCRIEFIGEDPTDKTTKTFTYDDHGNPIKYIWENKSAESAITIEALTKNSYDKHGNLTSSSTKLLSDQNGVKTETAIPTRLYRYDKQGNWTTMSQGDYTYVRQLTYPKPVDTEASLLIYDSDNTNLFQQWVVKQLVYPQDAIQRGVEGRVIVSFIVMSDGSLQDIKAIESPDPVLSEEVIRAVSKSVKWDATGKTIEYSIPVIFSLSKNTPTIKGVQLISNQDWILSQISYPEDAGAQNIEGQVIVSFTVCPDGQVTNVELVSAPYPSLGSELTEIIKRSPRWIPCRYSINHNFELNFRIR